MFLLVLLLLALMIRTCDYFVFDDMFGLPAYACALPLQCILHCFLLPRSGFNVVELVLTIRIHYWGV